MDFASLTMFVNTMFYPPAPTPTPKHTHPATKVLGDIYRNHPARLFIHVFCKCSPP